MAGSGTYQVNVGPIRDIAAPFLAGTRTLSGALQGITDDQLNQDKLAQTQLEHADRMKQMELNRAERVSARGRARSDAAARRAELKAEKKAQRDAIKSALTSFNTDVPDSINTGLETQQALQEPYTADTNKYNELSGILDTQDNLNINTQATAQAFKNVHDEETAQLQNILGKTAIAKNEVMGKGDAIQYDGEGKVIPNAGMQAIDAMQFGIKQRKQQLDYDYSTLPLKYQTVQGSYDYPAPDTLNPNTMAYNAVQGIADQQANVATDNRGVIAEQQSALDTAFDKRIGDLNTGIQTDYANDPQVLDKVTNQNRVANELYQSLLMKDVDPAVAAKTAQAWLKANPVKEVDKTLVTSLKDERTALRDMMATETKKTETGKIGNTKTSNGESYSNKKGASNAAKIFKSIKSLNNDKAWYSLGNNSFGDIKDLELQLKAQYPEHSGKAIGLAIENAVTTTTTGGMTLDPGLASVYLDQNSAGSDFSNGGKKLTSTLKRKTGTPEQNAKLRSIEQALNDARSPNRTPRDNLRNFSKAADVRPELAKALKVNKLPSKTKEPVEQPKKATKPVQTKEPVSAKTETKSSIKEALTPVKQKEKEVGTPKKPLPKGNKKVPFKNMDEYYTAAKARTKVKKELPSIFKLDTWKNAPEGAKIKFMQMIDTPVDTAKDFALGVANIIPGLASTVGDVLGVDTPRTDRATKVLKSNLSDSDALAFDLGEILGGGGGGKRVTEGVANTLKGYKATKKVGDTLLKSRKMPSVGEALGKTYKGIRAVARGPKIAKEYATKVRKVKNAKAIRKDQNLARALERDAIKKTKRAANTKAIEKGRAIKKSLQEEITRIRKDLGAIGSNTPKNVKKPRGMSEAKFDKLVKHLRATEIRLKNHVSY